VQDYDNGVVRRISAKTRRDALKRRLFWKGFDQEAKEYLDRYPAEAIERERFGRTSADGLKR
jgi:hypothetical protein